MPCICRNPVIRIRRRSKPEEGGSQVSGLILLVIYILSISGTNLRYRMLRVPARFPR
ncbi:hypothetical protein BO94DRAFT_184295 [Aspergillus sclerotioniger CBS 115572]|uniref:Uncharacterized protein n=1 Tax=Aspergillus sclerotioniger CBS 115572 TaxID=1450535 RepID=A0A317VYJ6_9EURO|nr:hypothetical protein BO94DRAFT_184295 [Aspergillus sclerotioniger CBS 115572]PWY78037.1 hypothetical protein BO94DRAFT_184295 [Aspergillus sclerotioniger CBS 115572]